jgi:Tfp pilus assembly protein PilO
MENMTSFNTHYLSWVLRAIAKKLGLWGLLSLLMIGLTLAMFISKTTEIQQEINLLETKIAEKEASSPSSEVIETPVAQNNTLQTMTEFYQTFPSAPAIPDTLSQLNQLAAAQQLLLNSGDYKLNKVVAKNTTSIRTLTQYEMVLPIEGSYHNIRAFIAGILSTLPSVAISDIQIKRESTLSPQVEARLVLIFFVRGDQT